jgi:hypothetical protein
MDIPVRRPKRKLAISGQNTNPRTEANPEGAIQLDTIPTKTKRPSKGMRKHNRRLKQEARRIKIPGTDLKNRKRPA